jgi:hypothetical protein
VKPGPEPPAVSVELLPDPEQGPVTADGPLRSIQEAELTMAPGQLRDLWTAETLERLGRGYWRHLSRISLRLLRVAYAPTSHSVLLLRRLELLRFGAPRYDTGGEVARVSWAIERGILVARAGRGRGELRFEARRLPGDNDAGRARIRIRAVVESYYPLLRGSGVFARIGAWIYAQTQLRIHVAVTRGFLRSLERGELPPVRPERSPSYARPLP